MTQPAVNKHYSATFIALPMWLKIIAFSIPLIGVTLLLGPVIKKSGQEKKSGQALRKKKSTL